MARELKMGIPEFEYEHVKKTGVKFTKEIDDETRRKKMHSIPFERGI